jgi:hypothetical protein
MEVVEDDDDVVAVKVNENEFFVLISFLFLNFFPWNGIEI